MREADRVNVLVVDDMPDVAQALAGMLELDGYATRVAVDAKQALSACAEALPHCALVDIDMPGVDGLQLAGMLRERYGQDIVLVAVTGWGEEDDRLSAAFAQVDHYLRKPVSCEQLRKLLPPLPKA